MACSPLSKCVKNRSLNKMPAVAGEILKCAFLNINIWNFPEIIHVGPFGNKASWVQVMARCRKGDKLLPEPILTHSAHVNNCILVSMSLGPGVF